MRRVFSTVAGYGETYYLESPEKNPAGPQSGTWRVFKGGSWYDNDPKDLRASSRMRTLPSSRHDDLGFRCAQDLK